CCRLLPTCGRRRFLLFLLLPHSVGPKGPHLPLRGDSPSPKPTARIGSERPGFLEKPGLRTTSSPAWSLGNRAAPACRSARLLAFRAVRIFRALIGLPFKVSRPGGARRRPDVEEHVRVTAGTIQGGLEVLQLLLAQ